jgi:hypothetical protein
MKNTEKNTEKKANAKNFEEPMSAEEFKFMLKRFRLKHHHVISESDYAKTAYYEDLQKSSAQNTPLKEYWVGILHNMVGEKAFNIARNYYKQTMESR